MGSLLRRLRSEEGGFTLIEMLLVTTLSIVVIGIPLTIGFRVFTSNADVSALTSSTTRAELMLDQMLNDVRNSYQSCVASGSTATPTTVSTTSLSLWVPVRSSAVTTCSPAIQTQQVTWTCTANVSCTRVVTGGSTTTLPGVVSATFTAVSSTGATATTNPAHIDVTITLHPTDDKGNVVGATRTPITVKGGTDLRNFS